MRGIAMRLEHQQRDLELVDAQMQDRVVELARDLQRPERRALRDHPVDIGGRRRVSGALIEIVAIRAARSMSTLTKP